MVRFKDRTSGFVLGLYSDTNREICLGTIIGCLITFTSFESRESRGETNIGALQHSNRMATLQKLPTVEVSHDSVIEII
jgi:hypothetical protein